MDSKLQTKAVINLEKLSIKIEGKIKLFRDKNELKEYMITKSASQSIVEETVWTEKRINNLKSQWGSKEINSASTVNQKLKSQVVVAHAFNPSTQKAEAGESL